MMMVRSTMISLMYIRITYIFVAGAWGINFMSEGDAAQFLKACSVSLVVNQCSCHNV